MKRKQKLLLNSSFSLVYQLIALVCGLVLPRFFLTTYGSEVNGLVSSITQFLGFISLCEMGVGAVIQTSLYAPLASGDCIGISKIAISSERFFKRIAYILLGYTLVLMIVYPYIVIDEFEYFSTFALIAIISISTFAQYYFGMTYRLILSADQMGFIHLVVHSVSLILNTVVCIIFMSTGMSIHFVKLATALIFLMQPLVVSIIAKRRYKIDRSIVLTEEPIKQKWNGLTQHIAAVVLGNTPMVVLTLLSTLSNVSIYSVYYFAVNGVKQIIISLTNGVQAMFGNMLANDEKDNLKKSFDLYEWAMHIIVIIVFSVTALVIIPFVKIYVSGVDDVNYIVPVFAVLITVSQALICLQLPYKTIVLAAGHYKQTQWSSIVEAAITIVASVVFVLIFGLSGVAIGTILAVLYRLVYLVMYLKKNILYRSLFTFLRHVFVDVISIATIIITYCLMPDWFALSGMSWLSWILLGIKAFALCAFECLLINLILNFKKICEVYNKFFRRVKKS